MPASKPAARSPIKNILENAEAALLPLPDALELLRRRHGLKQLSYAQLYARAIRREIPGVHKFHQRNFLETSRLGEIAALLSPAAELPDAA